MHKLSNFKTLFGIIWRDIDKKSNDFWNSNCLKKMEKIRVVCYFKTIAFYWGQRKVRRLKKENWIRRKNSRLRADKRPWTLWGACLSNRWIWRWRKCFWRIPFEHDWILRYCKSKNWKMERIIELNARLSNRGRIINRTY
jgi:hypothetical protein